MFAAPCCSLRADSNDTMEDPIVIQSAVRLPTPPPPDQESTPVNSNGKRKRDASSRSPSAKRHRSPGDKDVRAQKTQKDYPERSRPLRREKIPSKPATEEEKQATAKAEYERLLNARSGGTYIPPARLRALQAQITDKTSKEYQRMSWEALKKSINGLINKVNVSNIKYIVPELFGENLVRGRGLFCRSIMKAQAASLPFTPIYAAMAAIVNTKLPQVGELLTTRLIVQFLKAFKRNDKAVCLSSTTFIAHLCNQQVVHETLAAEMLLLLLNKPSDDSVEISVGLTREVGQHLEEMNGQIALVVFDQFRNILHEQDLDKRVQYMIEVLFQVRKDKYKDNPAIKDELDLVEEEDQITHQIHLLDDGLEVKDGLNIFKFDKDWEENEEAYKKIKAEILGEASGSEEDEVSGSDESSDEEEDEKERQLEIKDQTNTDLINLRRTIYLTIMSSIDFEECCHKLMKINLPMGQEPELPSMIVECCSQERTFSKFYGLIGERFAKLNRLWTELFEAAFAKYYDTIHRYESNRLRNIARFFGHMLSSNALGWHCLSIVHLNEEETTSSSRIFIKILFQDLSEALGLPKLKERFQDPILNESFAGIFPKENPRNIRFSINYFTSIGLGAITEEMREFLKNIPKAAPPALPPQRDVSDSESVSSYSSYTSSSRSYSRSRSQSRSRTAAKSDKIKGRRRSPSRSPSRSRSPPRRTTQKRGRNLSPSESISSRSRSPPAKRKVRARSESDSSRSRSRSTSESRSPSPKRSAPKGTSRRERKSGQRGRPRSRSSSGSRSTSCSTSRSRSQLPRRGNRSGKVESSPSRRERTRKYSSSVTPPPRRPQPGVWKENKGPARSPPPKNKHRNHSISRSRSPSPYRAKSNKNGFSTRGRGADRGSGRGGGRGGGTGGDKFDKRDQGRKEVRRNTSSPSQSRSRSRSRSGSKKRNRNKSRSPMKDDELIAGAGSRKTASEYY